MMPLSNLWGSRIKKRLQGQFPASGRRRPWVCMPLIVLLIVWLPLACRAEKYLSVEEARKLCFPDATRFVERTFDFTEDQVRAIQNRIRKRIMDHSCRVSFAFKGADFIGVLFADRTFGKHEWIDFALALSAEGEILQLEILEYRESHGAEIRNRRWRSQFAGKTSSAPFKLHDDVYNISGATISCRSVTDGVKRLMAVYDLLVRPLGDSPHELLNPTARPAP